MTNSSSRSLCLDADLEPSSSACTVRCAGSIYANRTSPGSNDLIWEISWIARDLWSKKISRDAYRHRSFTRTFLVSLRYSFAGFQRLVLHACAH
jgi:hypothetical protein